jgi:hypothetical protein
LKPDARQFSVIEAKVHAGLSKGTVRAPYYNQAARNVACMAETIRRTAIQLCTLEKISFTVLAPEAEIERGRYASFLTTESIHSAVCQRVGAYEGKKDEWFTQAFEPLMSVIQIDCISWESVIDWVGNELPDLEDFYRQCLVYA